MSQEELNESIQRGLHHHLMHRRAVLKRTAGAGIGLLGAAVMGKSILAQDDEGTPTAGEATQGGSDSDAAQGYQINPAARTPTPNGPAVPPEFEDPKNWPVQGYDLAQTRFYDGQNEISTDTAGQLGLAWATPFEVTAAYIPFVANPIGVDGKIYLQDGASNIHVLNADTGEVIWEKVYDQVVAQAGPNGIAVGYGIAVFGVGASGQVDALDTETGDVLWSISLEGPLGEGIDMAPLIYDNTVYISTVPGSPGISYLAGMRGFLYALDVWTGTVLWYFDTTTDNLWGGARLNAGGGLWNPPSIDVETGDLYVSVANAAPYAGSPDYPNATGRPGDNDYANSILRIDTVRGGIEWYLNVKPHDLFDLDQQLSPVLGTVTIDGADVDVVFATGKHGNVLAINRETGEELWRTPVGRHENDDVQEIPEGETLTVFPGNLGGVETPFAFADGRVFVALLNSPGYYTAEGEGEGPESLATANGQVVALDGASGEIAWDVTVPTPLFAAATVVNDIVFTGGLDGIVRGFDVADGAQVFSYQTASGLSAPLGAYGDLLLIPSGAPFIPSADTWNPAPEAVTQLIALKVGGTVQEAPGPSASPEASPAGGEATPAAAAATTELNVTAIDIAFEETELQAPADTDVTLTLTNSGVVQHDLVIEDTDYATPLIANGESASFTFNLPAGEYTYFCDVPGHRAAGMVGTLTVS
ncbi:MAG TPA: PQQ-binding-like beta-propeller repeat protein [Thermomicrobiales bacterium]|nr:PQQ-binding-like beta-propeller repeat protein [Thermomicrobiales bacterium]